MLICNIKLASYERNMNKTYTSPSICCEAVPLRQRNRATAILEEKHTKECHAISHDRKKKHHDATTIRNAQAKRNIHATAPPFSHSHHQRPYAISVPTPPSPTRQAQLLAHPYSPLHTTHRPDLAQSAPSSRPPACSSLLRQLDRTCKEPRHGGPFWRLVGERRRGLACGLSTARKS